MMAVSKHKSFKSFKWHFSHGFGSKRELPKFGETNLS